MKRSEMIKEVAMEIKPILNNSLGLTDLTSHGAERIVSTVLQALEDNGMMPPTITLLPSSYNRVEGIMGFEVNRWDEES